MTYRPVELRPNIRPDGRLGKVLLNRRCLHYDFWVMGEYLIVQLRAGGRELVASQIWDIALCVPVDDWQDGQEAHINSREPMKRAACARADALIVQPLLAEPTPYPYTCRSVCLHYWAFHKIDPITPDMLNFWKPGRGIRGGAYRSVGGRLPDVL